MQQNINKEMVSLAVVTEIKNDNPQRISAEHIEKYEKPESVPATETGNTYTPDMLVYYERGIDIYEIELENNKAVDKWKSFESFAKENNGYLYIVVPEDIKKAISNLIISENINAGIIYF
ncbi:MAG: hypothetical protein U9N72_12780 [Bacteroidota bacterium]|nr:hypothetical protein [Bacteroidota bacterium]